MTDDLPRRPFQELQSPPDGLAEAVAGGRRIRRRRQAVLVSGIATAAVLAAAVVVAGAGATTSSTDRLTTRPSSSPTPTATSRTVPRPSLRPGSAVSSTRPSAPGSHPPASTPPRPTATATVGYRTPPLQRSYQPADPLGARVCTPDQTNGRNRAGWCLDALVTRTSGGHDLTLSLCRDQTGAGTLTFAGEQEAELVVRHGSTEVWRWSTGQDLRGPGHRLDVDAGACWTWTAPWTDVDSRGRELATGSYTLTVTSPAAELRSLPDETTTFTA